MGEPPRGLAPYPPCDPNSIELTTKVLVSVTFDGVSGLSTVLEQKLRTGGWSQMGIPRANGV